MKRLVADAAALAAWFDGGSAQRAEYEAGALVIVGPTHLPQDLLGELVRRSGADGDTATRLAREIEQLGLELRDPPMSETARWVSRGIDPRRAAYAAIASSLDLQLETTDPDLRRVAATLTTDS